MPSRAARPLSRCWSASPGPHTATSEPAPVCAEAFGRASYAAVARQCALRYLASVVIPGCALATRLGNGCPYWTMVGAVVPLAARDLLPQLVRGAHPLIGTLFSLGQSALLFGVAPGELLVMVIIVLLQGLAKLRVGRNYSGRPRRCHASHDADWPARGPVPATAADHGSGVKAVSEW